MSMDVVLQTNFEVGNSALCIGLPFGCVSKAFKGGDVGVNVTILHLQLHELFVGILGACGVFPCHFECCFELIPQDFVGFCNRVCSTGGFCLKGSFLGIDPSINVWAAHIRECVDDSAELV